jgi:hypothetical protein
MPGKYVFWDCPYCGTKGIQKRLRTCPECSAQRPEEVQFYGPQRIHDQDARRMDMPAPAAANEWKCESCGAVNPITISLCRGCGASREAKPRFRMIPPQKGQGPPEQFGSAEWYEREKRKEQGRKKAPQKHHGDGAGAVEETKPSRKMLSGCIKAVAFLVVLLLVALFLWFIYKLACRYML